MNANARTVLKVIVLCSGLIFSVSAMAEPGKSVLTGQVRTEQRREPGIVGLDMLIRQNTYPYIQAVFPGTPAQQRGVKAGDYLVAVDGVTTQDKSDQQVDWMISDVPGTPVHLTLQRGERLMEVTVTVAAQHR